MRKMDVHVYKYRISANFSVYTYHLSIQYFKQ